MSVYQSSMLGDEDEDERDTGFRQVLDIMVTPVVSSCISNSTQKKTVRPKMIKCLFSIAYVISRNVFFFFSLCSYSSFCLDIECTRSRRRSKQTYRLWLMNVSLLTNAHVRSSLCLSK